MLKFSYEWKAAEFSHLFTESGWRTFWMVVLGASLIYAVATSDLLFTVILILALFLVAWQQFAEPRRVAVAITENAATVDGAEHPMTDFRAYALAQSQIRTILYLFPADRFAQSLRIPVGDGVNAGALDADLGRILKKENTVGLLDTLYRKLFP